MGDWVSGPRRSPGVQQLVKEADEWVVAGGVILMSENWYGHAEVAGEEVAGADRGPAFGPGDCSEQGQAAALRDTQLGAEGDRGEHQQAQRDGGDGENSGTQPTTSPISPASVTARSGVRAVASCAALGP